MSYQVSRKPKVIIGTIAAGLLLYFLLAPSSGAIKKSIFNTAFDHCASSEGLTPVYWHPVPAFDAGVRELTIDTPEEIAMAQCLNRWAGFIIDDHEIEGQPSSQGAHSILRVTESGSHLAPPRTLIWVEHEVYVAER